MLDARQIRAYPEEVKEQLAKRGIAGALDGFLGLDEERRQILGQVEELKSFRNSASQEVGRKKKEGQEPTELMEKVRQIGQEIKVLDDQLKATEAKIETILLNIPNLPHSSVPVGEDEASNVEIRRWGDPRTFGL